MSSSGCISEYVVVTFLHKKDTILSVHPPGTKYIDVYNTKTRGVDWRYLSAVEAERMLTIPDNYTELPKLVTLLGIVTVDKVVHPKNTESPKLVTPLGIVMADKTVHPENRALPRLVMLVDKVAVVIPLQF